MGLFKIASRDLKEFIINKKVIFIILFFSLMISSYGFLFFTSLNMNISQLMNSYKGATNNYFISNKNLTQNDIQEIVEFLSNKDIEITYNIFSNIEKGKQIENTNVHNKNSKKQLYNLIIGTNKTPKTTEDFVGKLMSEEDRKNCSNYIMIKDSGYLALNDMFILNKEVTFNNNSYLVKAIDHINMNVYKYFYNINLKNFNITDINDIEIGIIPDTTFYKDNYDICGLEIITPIDISEEDKMEFYNFLKTKFNNSELILPTKNTTTLKDTNYYTIFYIILMLLALVNIMALFTYWIAKNSRKYMIYRLCGASKNKIYCLIIMEALTICILSIISSIALYEISVPLLNNLDINYILNFSEISIIGVIILLLVFINVHLIAKNILKAEIRYLGRR